AAAPVRDAGRCAAPASRRSRILPAVTSAGGSMETVSFTRMADGTAEDYALLDRVGEAYLSELPDRVMAALEELRTSFAGYQVSRYEHSLQGATRAYRDGRDEEYIVATLLHDIGDELAPY